MARQRGGFGKRRVVGSGKKLGEGRARTPGDQALLQRDGSGEKLGRTALPFTMAIHDYCGVLQSIGSFFVFDLVFKKNYTNFASKSRYVRSSASALLRSSASTLLRPSATVYVMAQKPAPQGTDGHGGIHNVQTGRFDAAGSRKAIPAAEGGFPTTPPLSLGYEDFPYVPRHNIQTNGGIYRRGLWQLCAEGP